ncbi:MAG: undecaprenyl/decaprenyl-phosphate alpha-N-acetylglucosaminyl 1-phosphate transferase [Candidatus Eisenbacteria bacterium]|nr:undecaprenyl/decaprenyl-phosphate alpha-N-acetylglucosaminyl 1-phosphate transferase [Candidatus Eisenbacteria bacterium]MBP8136743.1 undecaprenyl/decaprenyl-phosphate alpha-N-acetylglucosaminyl 1-phosphate transferase [Candidatus Eisenbacteria bacterium]
MLPLVAFPIALLAALVTTPLMLRLAWATGYLDQPEARKLHTSATALLGGAAVFLAAMVGWAITVARMPVAMNDWEAYYLLAGAGVALGLGLWDDRFGMQPSVKMVGQAAAATLIVSAGVVPDTGLPLGVTGALAMIGVIALMNAVNFLDNMNGMVGGLAPIALGGFAWMSLERGAYGVAAAQLALAGACVGFLPFNFPRARIFLGDAGSLFLGYSLGASALIAMRSQPPGWAQVGPLLALGYPAFDMIFVILTRIRDKSPVYQGGKDHTNHRLATIVRQPTLTVVTVWLVAAALAASGFVLTRTPGTGVPALLVAAWVAVALVAGLRLAGVPVVRRTS